MSTIQKTRRAGAGLLAHHLPDEPVEGLDPALASERPKTQGRRCPRAPDVERSEVGEGAPALVGVLDPLPARAGRGRKWRVDARPGLARGLLVGADDEVAGVQELALPPALAEVEHRACPLQEGRVGGEDPGAALPGLERVLCKPAGDGRGGGLADPPSDDEPVQLSAREARERQAVLSGQLAGDRLHLRHLVRGENAADGPAAVGREGRPDAARRSACATARPSVASSRGGGRSPHSSAPRWRARRSSPAAPGRAAPCSGRLGSAAPVPPPRSARSGRGSSPSRLPVSAAAALLLHQDRARINGREHLGSFGLVSRS